MNRLSTPVRSSHLHAVEIVAKLDLNEPGQRELHDFIRRMHVGRWPSLRALGMRQIDGVIYEAAEWLRMVRPSYIVVRWRPDGLGMSSQASKTAREAIDRLNWQDPLSSPTGQPPLSVRVRAVPQR